MNKIKYIQQKHYLLLLLAIITLIVFSRVPGHEFVSWDDRDHVYENPYMNPVTSSSILHFWKKPHDFALTYTFWAIQAKFAKTATQDSVGSTLNPHIFHIFNLIFHILSVLIVFLILKILFKHNWAAFGGALFFAIHPVQVESVAWVTGLKDVLSGFLSLMAVWQYILYVKRSNKQLHYILSAVLFILAMTAKPTAVIVPVVILILDYWFFKRPLKKSIILLIGWVIISLPMIILAVSGQPTVRMKYIAPLWARLFIVGDTIFFYLYKLVLPFSLGIDYGRSPELVIKHGWVFFTWLIPFGLVVLLWLNRKRKPWLLISAGIFITSILPVSGLVPFLFQNFSTVADRYIYFAMLGPVFALTWFFSRNWRKKPIIIISFLILILLGMRCWDQTRYWENSSILFKRGLDVNFNSSDSHYNLGVVLVKQGKNKEAITCYSNAIRIKPDFVQVYNNMGLVLEKLKRYKEAISYYSNAIRLKPGFSKVYNNMGLVLYRQGKYEEAVACYLKAIRLNPAYTIALFNMGVALEKQGKYISAMTYYSEALQIKPGFYQASCNLGSVLERQGKIKEAITYYSNTLKINPEYELARNGLKSALKKQGRSKEYISNYFKSLKIEPEGAQAYIRQGTFFQKQGKYQEAIANYSRAIQIKPDYARAYFERGNALLGLGRLNEAAMDYKQVLKIMPGLAKAHNNLGFVLETQGKLKEAIHHYSEALRIDPGYNNAKKNLLRAQKKEKQ